MCKNKLILLVAVCVILFQEAIAFAYDTSPKTLIEKHHTFASQYDYYEGDEDKTFGAYPEIVNYASGIEYRPDGSEYECPAIYIDAHAMFFDDFKLEQKTVTFKINGAENPSYNKCVIFNDRVLVPAAVFKETGCDVSFDENTYVITISKDGTILELLPNLIGMRKNQQNGFYVPLEVCARFIDDVPYVPVRAIANEFQLGILWDAESRTVSLNS